MEKLNLELLKSQLKVLYDFFSEALKQYIYKTMLYLCR